jgi:hypothetical protein
MNTDRDTEIEMDRTVTWAGTWAWPRTWTGTVTWSETRTQTGTLRQAEQGQGLISYWAQRGMDTDTDRLNDTDRDSDTDSDRDMETYMDRDIDKDRDRETARYMDRDRDTDRDMDRNTAQTGTQTQIGTGTDIVGATPLARRSRKMRFLESILLKTQTFVLFDVFF